VAVCHSSGGDFSVSTTLYISQHFEVRNHDASIKYVFNGDTRVAHVTGSLSAGMRLERIRLHSGWNLCSIAVTATNLLSQISNSTYSQIAAAYKWNPTTTNWLPLANTETLQAGTVLWLKASTNAKLTVVGTYPEPTNIVVSPGGLFIASAGLEDWASSNVL